MSTAYIGFLAKHPLPHLRNMSAGGLGNDQLCWLSDGILTAVSKDIFSGRIPLHDLGPGRELDKPEQRLLGMQHQPLLGFSQRLFRMAAFGNVAGIQHDSADVGIVQHDLLNRVLMSGHRLERDVLASHADAEKESAVLARDESGRHGEEQVDGSRQQSEGENNRSELVL